jgi:hypothetical protein
VDIMPRELKEALRGRESMFWGNAYLVFLAAKTFQIAPGNFIHRI